MTERASADAVADIYAEVPSLQCLGKCQEACGPIEMSPVERRRMEERGDDIPAPLDLLSPDAWTALLLALSVSARPTT